MSGTGRWFGSQTIPSILFINVEGFAAMIFFVIGATELRASVDVRINQKQKSLFTIKSPRLFLYFLNEKPRSAGIFFLERRTVDSGLGFRFILELSGQLLNVFFVWGFGREFQIGFQLFCGLIILVDFLSV